MSAPRIVVFGYNEVGFECLQTLIQAKANVVAVFTHQDKPKNELIWYRSVKNLAEYAGIPVYLVDDPNTPDTEKLLQSLAPDLIFSFYFRERIGERILALARLGAYNMHGSLLPTYRGRVPTNWSIIHGQTQTGASLHHMVHRFDAGDLVDQEAVSIGAEETAQDVFAKVTKAAANIIKRQLPNLLKGTAPRIPQNNAEATYFGGRKPADGKIHWEQSGKQIFNLIRAVTYPYPGAFTELKQRKLFIWWAKPMSDKKGQPGEVVSENPLQIATGDGVLEILRYQWQDGPILEDPTQHGLTIGQQLNDVVTSE